MYLSARNIAEMVGQHKAHFLNPDAIRSNKSIGDAVGLKRLGAHIISVPPGHASTEHHAHMFEEELIYVLSGQGVAHIGESEIGIGPGDFIGCPTNGVAHSLVATGADPLECLVVGQRLVQDVTDYPRQKKRLYRNDGLWNVVDHSSIHDVKR